MPEHLLDGPWQIIEDVVLEGEVPVLVAGDAPVEHVDVESLTDKILDKAVARHEVEDIGPVDEGVDQEDGDGMLLLGVGGVVVEPRFVLGPDRLLGSLPRVGLGTLDDDPHTPAVLVEEVLYVGGYGGIARRRNRAVVGGLGHLALLLLAHVLDGRPVGLRLHPAFPGTILERCEQPVELALYPVEPRLELLDGLARGGLGVSVLEVFEDLFDAVDLLLQVHDEAGDPGDVGTDGELKVLEVVLGIALEHFVEAGVALEETARRLEELLALDNVTDEVRKGPARGVVPLGREL